MRRCEAFSPYSPVDTFGWHCARHTPGRTNAGVSRTQAPDGDPEPATLYRTSIYLTAGECRQTGIINAIDGLLRIGIAGALGRVVPLPGDHRPRPGLGNVDRRLILVDRQRPADDLVGVGMHLVAPAHEMLDDRAAALERQGTVLLVGRQFAFRDRRMPLADAAEVADFRPDRSHGLSRGF